MNLTNCTVSGNDGNIGGGVLASDGTLNMTNCTLSQNKSSFIGGGLSTLEQFTGTTVTMTYCTVSGNTAAGGGGGLYNHINKNAQYRHADRHDRRRQYGEGISQERRHRGGRRLGSEPI